MHMMLRLMILTALLITGCEKRDAAPIASGVPAEPVDGGTLTIAVDSGPGTLNPVLRTTALAGNILGIMNDGLVRMNTNLDFEPSLARRWVWSEDGLGLTYHLRDDVRWSDGEALTARDVVATYALNVHPDVPSPRRSNFEDIESVTAPDDTTVVFRFLRRSPEMIFNSAFSILPAHTFEDLDPARIREWPINRTPLANGAFRLAEWVTNERLILERNPYYWGEPAHLERVVFRVVPEEATRLLQLEIGEADMIEAVPQKDVERLKNNRYIVLRQLGPRYLGYLVYNLDDPDLADVRVRNAISHAIDRRAFVEGLLFGFGRSLANPMTPLVGWAYHDGLEAHRRDTDLSRRLLSEAGYSDSNGDGFVDRGGADTNLSFTIKTRTGDPVRENGVLVVQNNLREVGIDAKIRMLELSTVIDQVRKGDFDVYMGQVSSRLSPDLSGSVGTDGGFNYGHYSSAEVDSLLGLARTELDRGRAATLWRQVQERIYEDQPLTVLYAKDPLVGLRAEVQNATPNFLTPYEDLQLWWKLPPTDGAR